MKLIFRLLLVAVLAGSIIACDDKNKGNADRSGSAAQSDDPKQRLEDAKARMADRRAERQAARQGKARKAANDTPADDVDAPELTAEQRAALRLERQLSRAWWNSEEIAGELALGEQQRAQMDQLLTDLRTGEGAQIDTKSWVSPLMQGDLDGARQAAAEVADKQRDKHYANMTLMVDIFALLDPTQQSQVVAEHPELLSAPAVQKENAGTRRAGRGGGKGRAAKSAQPAVGDAESAPTETADTEPAGDPSGESDSESGQP